MDAAQEFVNTPLKTNDVFLPVLQYQYPSIELPPAALPLAKEASWEPRTPLCLRHTAPLPELRSAKTLTDELNTAVHNLMQNNETREASGKRQKTVETQLAEFQSSVHQMDLRVRLAMMESFYQLATLSQPESSPSHHTTSFQFLDAIQKLLPPPVSTTPSASPSSMDSSSKHSSPVPSVEAETSVAVMESSTKSFASPSSLVKTRMFDASTPSPSHLQRHEALPLKPSALFTSTPPPPLFGESFMVSPSVISPFFSTSQRKRTFTSLELDFASVW
jgi:hypothetical protein